MKKQTLNNGILMALCILAVCVSGCMNDKELYDGSQVTEKSSVEHAEKAFGITFDATHDWKTTTSGKVTITADAPVSNIVKVQVLAYTAEGDEDGNATLKMVNETACTNGQTVTLSYDVPTSHLSLYAACVGQDGEHYFKAFDTDTETVTFGKDKARKTRAEVNGYTLPDNPKIERSLVSFARQRGYDGFENDMLYQLSETGEASQVISVDDYDEEFAQALRAVVFSIFPNGKTCDNLPQIKNSGYYNATCYPVTTGKEPIIVSPVYKNDGTSNEVVNCDLYYYYYKEADLGDDPVQYIKDLPKYKAIQLNRSIRNNRMPNDKIVKQDSYTLIYFGEGTPTVGQTTGSYLFPEGYKIGFMLRSKVNSVKEGELYCDGRLNNQINKYGHFASSKLGDNDPRMAWITVNKKLLLCCESGTDRDFNDLLVEVEGGIESMVVVPDIDANYYTFCYEDQPLGDYDMNDVVLRGRRLDDTHVEYTLLACGAADELYLHNIEGKRINAQNEVHSIFGRKAPEYVNTTDNDHTPFVRDTITVEKDFSFLNPNTQPYLYDKTSGHTVKIATIGEDPHAIMVPDDLRWPLERTCIKDAYLKFNNWGQNKISDTDWYKYEEEDKVY